MAADKAESLSSKAQGQSIVSEILHSNEKRGLKGISQPTESEFEIPARSAGIEVADLPPLGLPARPMLDRFGNKRRSTVSHSMLAFTALGCITLFTLAGLWLKQDLQHQIASTGSSQFQVSDVSLRQLQNLTRLADGTAVNAGKLKVQQQQLAHQLSEIDSKLTTLQVTLAALNNSTVDRSTAKIALDEALVPLQTKLSAVDLQVNDLVLRSREQADALARLARSPATTGEAQATSANDELVLLKERNRLTLLADEVMATGKSAPMRDLWRALRDPERSHLRHAVAAEIIRVQNHLDHLTRLPPDYRLPIKELFPEQKVKADQELPTEALVKALNESSHPLPVRARVAALLSGRKSPKVAQALIAAMNTDTELDVVKEAQRSLQETYQFKLPLFDTQGVESWWKRNTETATTQDQ